MKTKVKLSIFLFFGLSSLVYVFPFIFVEAAKLESGVTVTAPSTTETEKICDDTIDNDNDGKIDANDSDCAAAPAGPTRPTCGLQISGVPIDYRFVFLGQESDVRKVTIKNEGTALAYVMVKGGNWISDADPNYTISGPEITHVGGLGNSYSAKRPLTSNGWEFGQIGMGETQGVYFQLKIPLSVNGVSSVGGINTGDKFHQEVTIDLIC